jgi:hypothetical protein
MTLYDEAMPKFRWHSSPKIWVPTKVRKRHFCRECRQVIGKGSLAYKPTPPGGIASHRICAACANELIRTDKVITLEDDHGRRPTSSDGC